MSLLFKMLAVIGSGAFLGVLLAIRVILGGYWRSLPPAEFLDWFAGNAPLFRQIIPIVLLPTLLGLAGAVSVDWTEAAARRLWLAAAGCILALLVLTALWFVPANAAFAAKTVPLAEVPARLDAWLLVHTLRIALALAASALAALAITR